MVTANDNFVLFKVRDLFCTLSSLDVQEIMRNSKNITPVKQAADYVKGVINLRGQIVTIFDLSRLFDFEQPEQNEDQTIIIVNFEGEQFGFLISEIIDIVTPHNSDIENSSVMPQNIQKDFVERVISVNNELYSVLSISNLVACELV